MQRVSTSSSLRRLAPPAGSRGLSTAPAPLLASRLRITRTTSPTKPPTGLQSVPFGTVFTDHMLEADWTAESGWTDPVISPMHRLSLHPASCSLHYGIQCFEGLKAFRGPKGEVRLFRPDLNLIRFERSLKRLELPSPSKTELLELLKAFVKVEAGFVPSEAGASLYLRPFCIGNQESVGVTKANSAKFMTIACPVGPYFSKGRKSVELLAESRFTRACGGGTGSYKLGANYAIALGPQAKAAQAGYDQVLWLEDGGYLSEVGTMNVFVVFNTPDGKLKEIVTPSLEQDTILPGVTRDSVVQLCKDVYGADKVSERRVTMREVRDAAAKGLLGEAFGAGTAAVISPIRSITYENIGIKVPVDPSTGFGPVGQRMLDEITAIQRGTKGDHEWSIVVA